MTKTELNQKWDNLKQCLKDEGLDSVIIDSFFGPLKPSKYSDSQSTLFVIAQNSTFFQNIIDINYKDQIAKASNTVFGKNIYIKVIDTDIEEGEEADNQQKEDYLNPKYTFSSFVQGPTNRMACVASMALADGYNKSFNPLFIYAESGLGKTHLMHAIGNYVHQHKPKKKILYVSAESFISELIDAIQHGTQQQFKNKYRKVDYLLFDDVQFLINSNSAKDELFNTFEALHNNGKQMVFTSDRPAKELNGLPERLLSRFVWGMTVDIQPPDYETRMAILKNKALLENVDVSNNNIIESFDFIARSIKNNIRELEGAFNRVLAFSAMSNTPINLTLTKKVLSDLVEHEDKIITIDTIKAAVADYYGITKEDLESSKRNREISYPRHIAVYLTRNLLELSYPVIAKSFGGKNHSSIIYSVETITEELKKSKDLQDIISSITNKIKD